MRFILFVSIYFFVLNIMPCQCTLTSDLIATISPSLDAFCPNSKVCTEYRPDFVPGDVPADKVPCCEECSCAEDCHINGVCCFPEEDNTYAQCVYLTIPQTRSMFGNNAQYNMIYLPPINGCMNEMTSSSKQPINQAPWGDLYPVSSQSTKQIYKNQSIAECHNVSDWVLWKVNMSCPANFDIKDMANALVTIDPINPVCSLEFLYPGDSKDMVSERCYPDIIDSCLVSSFNIPEHINLTHKDYIDLCQSGFNSIMDEFYKNIFCYICNGEYLGFARTCTGGFSRTPIPTFSFILNPEYALNPSKSRQQAGDLNVEMACPIFDMKSDECRSIQCPEFHIRDVNGNCIPQGDSVGITIFEMKLMLIPETPIQILFCKMNKVNQSDISNLMLKAPWNIPWRISKLMCHVDDPLTNGSTLYIVLAAKTDANIAEFLKQVSETLQERWEVKLNDNIVYMKQHNRGFYMKAKTDQLYQLSRFDETNGRVMAETLSILYYYRWESSFLFTYPTLHLTPLFFCKLIELKPHEYNIDENGILTIYSDSRLILLRNEYNRYQSTVQICLDRSGFEARTSTANALHYVQQSAIVLLELAIVSCIAFQVFVI